MNIGVFARNVLSFGSESMEHFVLENLISEAQLVADAGFTSYWLPQQADLDAIQLAVLITNEVPSLELGTTVVPIQTRFPIHMAQEAATAYRFSNGRFVLGIGVEHKPVVEDMWGLSFDRIVDVMSEYVQIVVALLKTGRVQFKGDFYNVDTFFYRFPPMPDAQVILGALGKRMLTVAGTHADGTTTWLAGINTVRDHIAPTIAAAAEEAGRSVPRVVVLLPVVVTQDRDAALARVSEQFEGYTTMPSYRSMLDREHPQNAGDVAIVGSRDEVIDQLGSLGETGATDFGAILFAEGQKERDATIDTFLEAARFVDLPAPA